MKIKGLTVTCVNGIKEDGALCRYPENVYRKMKYEITCHMYGQEIRFRPLQTVSITLSCLEKFEENKVEIYYGDHMLPHEVSFKEKVTLEIKPLKEMTDQKLIDVFLEDYAYHPELVRIVLLSKRIRIDEVRGDFVDPQPGDCPEDRILVYGTSLSQGTSTHLASLNYPSLLGRWLRMDVDNYSLAGQCLLEDYTVDFLSSLKEEYKLILLEPSTNLLAQGYTKEEFTAKVQYALHSFRTAYPDALIVCLDLFESLFDYGVCGPFHLRSTPDEYRRALKTIVSETQDEKILLIETKTLLDRDDLSLDMMHPTSLGYFSIASRLYEQVKERLNK